MEDFAVGTGTLTGNTTAMENKNTKIENHNNYIRALVISGLSIIPIAEGKKNPHWILGKTHNLEKVIATQEEVETWIKAGVTSWGVAGGKVSGNLVTLDFDEKHHEGLYGLWYAKLSDDQRKIVDTCHRNHTRNKGTHLHYRTQTPQPTDKLARRLEWSGEEKKEKIVTTSETKAEGGYALIPPSAGYTTVQGSLLNLPLITDEMHEELIDVLRVFDEIEDEPVTEYEWRPKDTASSDRPGDRFNKQATWKEILEPYGWVEVYADGWARPGKGKDDGISATTNYKDRDILYVFSTNAHPFIGPHGKKKGTGYSKFRAFALLNHDGDTTTAAKAAADKYPLSASEESLIRYHNILDKVPIDTPKESIFKAITPLLELLASDVGLGEAEIYIQNKIKEKFDLKGKVVDSIIKDFRKMRTSVQAKIEAKKKKAELLEAEPPLTDDEINKGECILKSPTLLYDILEMVKKLGVVGEEKNILLHYIIFTSRKLKHPLSATVKGDSSSGKSYTLLTTIKMFPKSAYIDLTDATPQSFYYCPEDHFKNKIIVIFEKHGGERSDYAIRTLQSEGKLKIQVTVKNPETGQFEAQTIEKEGPTGFVTTTTASFIHAENDTRNISMFPDQSSEQTSRVYESVDSRYLGTKSISDNELKPWRHAQLVLEQIPVHIPYVRSFRKYFPQNIIRTRRDYGHFLAIVETVAFLHQKQREIIELNGQKYIRAIIADAYIAKIIVEESLSKSIYELPEKTVEVIEIARELIAESDDKDETFTITQLSKRLGWDRDTVAKWMKPASKKGYLTVVEESRGSKGAEYKVEDKELPSDSFLPSINDLAADNPTESVENIYDPLTGNHVSIQPNQIAHSTDAPIDIEAPANTKVDKLAEFTDECLSAGSIRVGASVQSEDVNNGGTPISETYEM